jgi:hypothetical protein
MLVSYLKLVSLEALLLNRSVELLSGIFQLRGVTASVFISLPFRIFLKRIKALDDLLEIGSALVRYLPVAGSRGSGAGDTWWQGVKTSNCCAVGGELWGLLSLLLFIADAAP